mgnify:FL=1
MKEIIKLQEMKVSAKVKPDMIIVSSASVAVCFTNVVSSTVSVGIC